MGIFFPLLKRAFLILLNLVFYTLIALFIRKNYSLVYSTEILWNSSGEIGMGPQKEGLARIKFAV